MPDPVYTLERRAWRAAGGRWLCLPGADRLATFPDRDSAEAASREAEWAVRRRANPFLCGGPLLHYQTTFDAARLFDWCLDAGLDPPGVTPDSEAWAAWWTAEHRHLTDRQRAAVWDALDRVRFFRVAEAVPGRPGHLVALPHQEEDPIQHPFHGPYRFVGSTPYMVTRNQATADDMCHMLYVNRVVQEGGYVGDNSGPDSWQPTDSDPFAGGQSAEESYRRGPTAFAEHRPVEVVAADAPWPGQDVYVVLRRHWRLEEGDNGSWRWTPTRADSCGRAVAAFDTLAAADACQARLEADARREVPSVFRFGPPHEWGTLHTGAIWGVLSELAEITFTSMWADYKAPERVWCRWWDDVLPGLTPEGVATAWDLYDKLKFYEVVAVEYRE